MKVDIQELSYTLPVAHVQIIMDALSEMPWRLAEPVIREMRTQADKQVLEAQSRAEATE